MGEILVSEGVLSIEQLEAALEHQKQTGDILGHVLLEMGLITETDITKTICIQYQLPFLSIANYDFNQKLVEIFPREFLHRHKLLPFDKIGKTLLLLVAEVPDPEVLAEVPKRTNLNAAIYVGYLTEVQRMLNDLVPLPTGDEAASPAGAAAAKGVTGVRPDTGHSPAKVSPTAAPKVAAKKTHTSTIEIVPAVLDDDDDEKAAGKNTLFGDSKESFLEELDSTWNSIFQLTEPLKDDLQEKDDPQEKD
jgi:hypothetical protein